MGTDVHQLQRNKLAVFQLKEKCHLPNSVTTTSVHFVYIKNRKNKILEADCFWSIEICRTDLWLFPSMSWQCSFYMRYEFWHKLKTNRSMNINKNTNTIL